MATRESSSGHKAFAHPFHHALNGGVEFPPQPYVPTSVVADPTVVTTLLGSSHALPGDRIRPSGSEVRARKSGRKRSRASRRAPTTLLSTDTTNFRAMVQQFTGVPTEPYVASCGSEGRSTLDFGFESEELVCQADTLPIDKPIDFYHHRQQQQQQDYYKYGPTPRQEEAMGFITSEENVDSDPLARQGEGFFLDVLGRHLMLPPEDRGDTNTYFC